MNKYKDLDVSDLNAEQRLTKVMLGLRKLWPYYSSIYESLQRVEDDRVGTMGVTVKHLVYSKEFVESIAIEELMFVNLHELGHVALKHPVRTQKRDQTLWNYACDLYVNAVIVEEIRNKRDSDYMKLLGYIPRMLEGGLYSHNIDIYKQSAESIYDILEKQANDNGYFKNKKDNNQSSNSGDKYTFTISGRYGKDSFEVSKNDLYAMGNDLLNNGSDPSLDDKQADDILNQAAIRSKFAGNGSCNDSVLGKLVLSEQKYRVQWDKLLRKYLIEATSQDSSFRYPDKRMQYQSAIYPGKARDDAKIINGLAICIDTSGSISDETLSEFASQLFEMMKQYKITGKVYFWDTEVLGEHDFKDPKTFLKAKPPYGGGTDPECIFKHFLLNRVHPVATVILTDGYFVKNGISSQTYKKFHKDTIWVIDKNDYDRFNPPFGKKAMIKNLHKGRETTFRDFEEF